MVGIIIITHGNFGEKLLEAAQGIVGLQRLVAAISISYAESPAIVKERLEKEITSPTTADGWLILTDMVGGTPCNVCLTLIEKFKDKFEILSGVNMYMVITAFIHREKMPLIELKRKVMDDAKASVMDVKEKFFRLHTEQTRN